jgi:hypothetical protein
MRPTSTQVREKAPRKRTRRRVPAGNRAARAGAALCQQLRLLGLKRKAPTHPLNRNAS